jgi:hypothetical protein
VSSTTTDSTGGVFGVLALICGLLAIFWVPFAFAPVGLACLVIAIMVSPKYKGLYEVAAVAIGVGVIVGGTVAVLADNPIY